MKRQIIYSLLSTCLTFGAVPSHADEGVYVKALAGLGQLADSDFGSASLGNGEGEFELGFAAGAAAGYDFGRWRLEGELLYRTNTLERVSGTVFDGVDDGDFSSLGFGVNALVDFNLLPNPKITSYAGMGVVWFQEIDMDFETGAGEFSYSGDDTALQFMLGSRYQLNPRLAVYAEVRQLVADGIELEGEGLSVGTLEADYSRTEFVLGLGYRF